MTWPATALTSDYTEHFRSELDKTEIVNMLTSGGPVVTKSNVQIHVCYICEYVNVSNSVLGALCLEFLASKAAR